MFPFCHSFLRGQLLGFGQHSFWVVEGVLEVLEGHPLCILQSFQLLLVAHEVLLVVRPFLDEGCLKLGLVLVPPGQNELPLLRGLAGLDLGLAGSRHESLDPTNEVPWLERIHVLRLGASRLLARCSIQLHHRIGGEARFLLAASRSLLTIVLGIPIRILATVAVATRLLPSTMAMLLAPSSFF